MSITVHNVDKNDRNTNIFFFLGKLFRLVQMLRSLRSGQLSIGTVVHRKCSFIHVNH